MPCNCYRVAQLSVLAATCALANWINATNAEESVLVKTPAATESQTGPILPPPSNPKADNDSNASGDVFAPTPVPSTKSTSLPTPPQTNQSPPQSSAVKRPFMRPAIPREPAQGKLVAGEEMPLPPGSGMALQSGPAVPLAEAINVKPAPPIEYDTDHDARKKYRSGKIDLVMVTKNPSDGCFYEIPMCIPACCLGDPQVKGGVGILGRGKVEYRWPCGFRAIVKFRHVLGDVKVEYEGD